MSKWIALPVAIVAVTALSVNVDAAPKPTTKGAAPKTTKTTKTTSSTSSPKIKSTASSTKAKGPKTTTTTTAKGNSAKGSSTKKNASTATATTTTTATTSTGTSTAWQPTNAVAEKLVGKPNQLARAKAVLPAGTDINDATAGFKNFGQFNAAVNVSNNLGIDFADLKASMTGITLDGEPTNQPTKSLGQAIKEFRPGVDADAEAASATAQATRESGQ